MTVTWHWLGTRPYARALATQLEVRDRVVAGAPPVVLACVHPTVITLGKYATGANVLASPAELATQHVEVVRIQRGGDVTLHDPGQLMIYPIVPIGPRGVRPFLALVATAIVAGLRELGADACQWQENPAGIWHRGAKVAACGIHVAHGVASHGFAVNVATPPTRWALIRPCGLAAPVVSVAELVGHSVTMQAAALAIVPRVAAQLAAA